MKTLRRWLQIPLAAIFLANANLSSFADEQPPYNVTDPAVSENFRNAYLGLDKINLLLQLVTYTFTGAANLLCIDSPTFCVDAVNHQILASSGTVTNPAYSFASSPSSGLYKRSTPSIGIAVNGVRLVEFDSAANFAVDAVPLSSNGPGLGDTGHFWNTLYVSSAVVANGTAAAPSYTFSGDADTGFYHVAANSPGFAQNGTLTWALDSGGYWRSQGTFGIQGGNGTVGTPTYGFVGDEDTGIYRAASNDLGLVAGGSLIMEVTPTKVISSQVYLAPDGSAGVPSYSFGGDQDTGIYSLSSGSNVIAFASAGALKCTIGSYVDATGSGFATVDGSASVPGYAFDQDTNTGFYRIGSDQFAATAGGAKVMTFGTGGTANATAYTPARVNYGAGGQGVFTGQTTTGVTTTGSYIIGVSDALIIVNGNNASVGGAAYFRDLIVCSYNAACTVLNSGTASGAPAARTYASDGTGIKLTMASSTYAINAFAIDMSRQ